MYRTNEPAKDWDRFCDENDGEGFEAVPEEYHLSKCCREGVTYEGEKVRCKECGCFTIVDEEESFNRYEKENDEYQAECEAEAAMEDY